MTDVGTPSDLVPLKGPLVEAVIEAYMAHKVTDGSDFEFYEGAALVDLLLLEARTANRIAEHCVDISTGFSRTEDEISATLQRLETRLGS